MLSKIGEHFTRLHSDTRAGNDKETTKAKKVRFDAQATLPKLGFISIEAS